MLLSLALAIGVIAGLRALTVPAAIAWAAWLGVLQLEGTWLSFFHKPWLPWLLTALAAGELVTDQLPSTPSRTVPVQFATRLLTGSCAGAAIGASADMWIAGAAAGCLGAVLGTLGGRAARAQLAASFGRDRPAALIEDAAAILGAASIVAALA